MQPGGDKYPKLKLGMTSTDIEKPLNYPKEPLEIQTINGIKPQRLNC